MPMTPILTIKKIVRTLIIVLVSIQAGGILLLNIPYIQRQISAIASTELARLFHTDVQIARVDMGFLNRIIIDDVEVKDQQGGQLLSIPRFSVKYEIIPLLHGRISINSVQLFGLKAQLSRPTPDGRTNFQFILDALAPKDTVKKEKMPLDLRINSVLIRRGQVAYDVLSADTTPGRFNPSHIRVGNISATLSLKALRKDTVNATVKRMSFTEQSGLRLKKLALKLTANQRGLHLNSLQIMLPGTTLRLDTLTATYDSLPSLPRLGQDVTYKGALHAEVRLQDLAPLVPAFAHFADPLFLDIDLNGRGKSLSYNACRLYTEEQEIALLWNGILNHWDAPAERFVYTNVEEARVSKEGFDWLFRNLGKEGEVPEVAHQIGFVQFAGTLSGLPHKLTTHGTLRSGAGLLSTNVTMHTDTVSQLHSFSGQLQSNRLHLDCILGKKSKLGDAAFRISLNGFRYGKSRYPESHIKGVISSIEYSDYTYHNIQMDGLYKNGGFNGQLSLDDENGKINLTGEFNTAQRIPSYNLRMAVRNFRPHALNLTKKYADSDFSLDFTADFSGRSVDDMNGRISLENLSLVAPDSARCYFLDSLHIIASKGANSQNTLRIESPFMQGNVVGRYAYHTLPVSFMRTAQRYIPALLNLKKNLPEPENDFKFDIRMSDASALEKLLDVPLQLTMPATLKGYINDSIGRVRVEGYFPEVYYNGQRFESSNLTIENPADRLKVGLNSNILLKSGAMLALSARATAANDELRTLVNWGNNTSITYSGRVFAITHFTKSDDKDSKLRTDIELQPSQIVLNDTIWNVHPSTVTLDSGKVYIDRFLFESNNRFIKANGTIGKEDNDVCVAQLKDIDLGYILDMVQFDAVQFNGLITGNATLKRLMQDPEMKAELEVNDFQLNKTSFGRAKIHGEWDKELGGVRLLADMKEDTLSTTHVTGYVSPKLKGLDLHIQAGGTNLAFLRPFVSGIMSNLQGRVHGFVRLYGPFKALDLEGRAVAEAQAKIDVLNTTFHIHRDSVFLSSGAIDFPEVTISDDEGHTGTVNGYLHHRKLKDLMYHFDIETNNMLVYNTNEETNKDMPFYGKVYATGHTLLRGGGNALNVDASLTTNRNTTFTYVTGIMTEATSNQFITFVDRTPKRMQEQIQTELYHHLNTKKKEEENDTPADIRINMMLDATPGATMRIIMDPIAGDYIAASGSGSLQINFFNKGDFKMFGSYTINEGIYKLSLQEIIRKDFVLQPGGTVTFNGDPTHANLNVQAVYTVNSASLNDLTPNALTTQSSVRVNCLMNLQGNLTAPSLKFDLELPTVTDEDRELVRSVTSTEEQMNTQIIYLLGIGKFYNADYANGAQSDASSSLAFSTLSGQLNNMLSQMINSNNWNLGTNLSTGDKGWSDVEAEAILSGRLLNNRLLINGNFGYKENVMTNTNFIGDFEAIWLLTPSGEFRLRGYNQTNDRYYTRPTLTTQGIGFIYKKDFTQWNELINWYYEWRKRKQEKKLKNQPNTEQIK